jgi:hypothetical protein
MGDAVGKVAPLRLAHVLQAAFAGQFERKPADGLSLQVGGLVTEQVFEMLVHTDDAKVAVGHANAGAQFQGALVFAKKMLLLGEGKMAAVERRHQVLVVLVELGDIDVEGDDLGHRAAFVDDRHQAAFHHIHTAIAGAVADDAGPLLARLEPGKDLLAALVGLAGVAQGRDIAAEQIRRRKAADLAQLVIDVGDPPGRIELADDRALIDQMLVLFEQDVIALPLARGQHAVGHSRQLLQQALDIDGLGDVVIDAEFDGAEQVFDVVVGAHHDDGLARHDAADFAAHGQAADARHLDVGDHDIGTESLEQIQALPTIDGDMQLAHPGFQHDGQFFPGCLVVLDVEETQGLEAGKRFAIHDVL